MPSSHAEVALSESALRLWEHTAEWAALLASAVESHMGPGGRLHPLRHWRAETPSRDHASDKEAANSVKVLEDEGDRLVYALTERVVRKHVSRETRSELTVAELLNGIQPSRSERSFVLGGQLVMAFRPANSVSWPPAAFRASCGSRCPGCGGTSWSPSRRGVPRTS